MLRLQVLSLFSFHQILKSRCQFLNSLLLVLNSSRDTLLMGSILFQFSGKDVLLDVGLLVEDQELRDIILHSLPQAAVSLFPLRCYVSPNYLILQVTESIFTVALNFTQLFNNKFNAFHLLIQIAILLFALSSDINVQQIDTCILLG